MWEALVTISKKKLTKKQIEERLEKYSSFADVPEYPYRKVKDFEKEFRRSLKGLNTRVLRYERMLMKDEETKQLAKEMLLPMIEVLSKRDLKTYIEYIGHGAYRVEGDTVYCTKNYNDGKFDFIDFNSRWIKLKKKNGRSVFSCEVREWDIYDKQSYFYGLLYDYDNDKWYEKPYHSIEACEKWEKNYEKLVKSTGATYAYAVPYHC